MTLINQCNLGDCLEVMRGMPENSVDSIVTDPPYGLSFMGKKWDYDVPSTGIWAECLRVLKPGGHLLAFAGTRTQHRMAVRIEDAGFEIRDMLAWVYGSGMPKSLDVSKAIDKHGPSGQVPFAEFAAHYEARRKACELTHAQVCAAGGWHGATNHGGTSANWANGYGMPTVEQWAVLQPLLGLGDEWSVRVEREQYEREVIGKRTVNRGVAFTSDGPDEIPITAPGSDAARQWQGWGTALKPALETVTFASKPYTDEQVRDIIQSNLFRLEARLWLLSSVNAAGKSSTSNQSEYGAACAIAQWNADEITSTRADLCGQMGTSLFALATTTSLNIVSSWRRTLDESWSDGSTSTIETKSSTTIDWRTLKFSVSQITPASIIKACSLPGGFSANASTAESHFNASLSLLQSIRTLSATEPVISLAQHEHQGAGVTPNLDPVVLARKPLIGTVAANVLQHGTGALNIEACRVDGKSTTRVKVGGRGTFPHEDDSWVPKVVTVGSDDGRWPANLIHDGSPEVLSCFPTTTSGTGAVKRASSADSHGNTGAAYGAESRPDGTPMVCYGDTGSAARFFYCAKASKDDRNDGTESLPQRVSGMVSNTSGQHITHRDEGYEAKPQGNHHPTVKPTDLMRYLCRLVTPIGGIILDPFMGSGSTGRGAVLEGFRFIGIEREAQYFEIAKARISSAERQGHQPNLFAEAA